MSHVIHSTLKTYVNISEALLQSLREKIIKIVSTMAQFYFVCPENSAHIRHYVDPITGRAIPVQRRPLKKS